MSKEIKLLNTCAVLRREVSKEVRELLDARPASEYISLLGDTHAVGTYKFRSTKLMRAFREMKRAYPEDASRYHAVIVLSLIEKSLKEIHDLNLTPEIVEICVANFGRIVANIEKGDTGYMEFPNDRFDKDLSAASMRLICAGARKLCKVYLPMSLVKRHPFAWIKCVMRVGLRGVLYEMHTDSNDPLLMADFNKKGLESFYRRTAELLKKSNVKGVIGTSWYYDPVLAEVSPRLTYLRSIVTENGGISVKRNTSPGTIQSATRTSATRRRMYQAGEYLPVAYTLVWPREYLLRWASGG